MELKNHVVLVGGFPGGSVLNNLLAKQETWVWSLGQEDPQEREMTNLFKIPAWEIPWTEEPGRLESLVAEELDMTEWLNNNKSKWIRTSISWLWVNFSLYIVLSLFIMWKTR